MSHGARVARWPLIVAALAGACTMAVEIAAVRLLSPWFGSSLVVWTNVLEIILLGLTLGYLAGARMSTAERCGTALVYVFGAGALFSAWTPALAAPVCEWFLPSGLALHDAAPLLTWGSLAAGLILFLPSAALLGMVGPLLVEEIGRSGERHAGSAGGRVLAASTLGSVSGAFATSYFALSHPALGVARTFVLVGIVLGLCAIWTAVAIRGAGTRRLVVLLPVLVLPAFFAGRLRLPALSEGLEELASVDSLYQTVRVVEDTRFERTLRYLQVNEGFDSFQSVWTREPGLLGEGFYYDDFALPAWWARATGEWRVLALGFGAGTVFRVLSGALPEEAELVLTGVEIDSDVVALGRRWLGLPENGEQLTVHAGMDARFALEGLVGPFDQIVLDAYANQVEIPPHLSTVEFFERVRSRLAVGGWVIANVGGFGLGDPVVLAIAETLAVAFEREVLVMRVPSARNYSLVVRREAEVPIPGGADWRMSEVGERLLGSMLDARELVGSWVLVSPPAVAPLTDDCNGIEGLQLRSLEEGSRRLHGGA